jgi:two-component system response regulator VicR
MAKKIMVVDDEPGIQRSVKRVLEKEGYDIVTASSGRECLDKLEKEHVDLIILDIIMPDMDGGMVAKQIRENKKYDDTKIIHLSVLKQLPGQEAIQKKQNIEYHIAKPFDNKDLIKKVKQVIG